MIEYGICSNYTPAGGAPAGVDSPEAGTTAMTLSEPVRAALIGATVTVAMSLLQLTVNARRQAAERAAGKPASRKPGNWLAVFALMLACAVGGYAYSEYQGFRDRNDERQLRQEMQERLRDIGAMAVRLEKVNLQSVPVPEAAVRLDIERKRGAEGVAAVVNAMPRRTWLRGLRRERCRAHGRVCRRAGSGRRQRSAVVRARRRCRRALGPGEGRCRPGCRWRPLRRCLVRAVGGGRCEGGLHDIRALEHRQGPQRTHPGPLHALKCRTARNHRSRQAA
jgi:hypothetical protein